MRKQVYELKPADLDRCPVWEFALDEEDVEVQDEATVRPFEFEGELDPYESYFVVRAKFTLRDGTNLDGYLTPADTEYLGDIHPVIVLGKGQVTFWWGTMAPNRNEMDQMYTLLGKAAGDVVFPIKFSSSVPLEGGPIKGEIPGFLVLTDWKQGTVRVQT